MNSLSFAVFSLIFNLFSVYSDHCFTNGGLCPQREYLNSKKNTSCLCSDDKDITCEDTRGLDTIFATLSNQLHHSLRYFKLLVVNDCNSKELKTNLFDGIKFETIKIFNCDNVEDFSPHIFSGTSDTLEELELDLIKNRDDKQFGKFWSDVFHSIGHLSELRRLKITKFKSMTIPDFGFKALSSSSLRITDIHFNNGRDNDNYVESIGRDAFNDLVRLTTLEFSNTEIGSVRDYAFRSVESSPDPLSLYLTAEKIMRTDFANKALKASNRVINLIINSNETNVTFNFNQTYIKPFLDENINNTIRIRALINCSEEFLGQNSWLLIDNRYKEQVLGQCSDGIDLILKYYHYITRFQSSL